ncbi:hypothetical protein PROAA_380004 [Candidatus Propionivibrio aalborgensis]|uniref:Uncharacterized protein n=1 Tax=Candidatus Propionivibrio aalborgensis TaxID=1860101 RepID=A0A1A8XZL0_9RHOO|nr:hypothetical protein PROAA_380004 [Candidatus Propionivibrio aalborgensis]
MSKTGNHRGAEAQRKSIEIGVLSAKPLCLCVSVVHMGLTHLTVLAMHGIVALHTAAIRQLPEKSWGFRVNLPLVEK